MKILVISGEISHQRPLTYGLPREWKEKTLTVSDEELDALVQKYGDIKSVPIIETSKFLDRVTGAAMREVRDKDFSAIIATGVGVHVAQSLIDSRDWNGPAVLIDPEGSFRRTQIALSEECDFDFESGDPGPESRRIAWILRDGHISSSQIKRIRSQRETCCVVSIADLDFSFSVYSSGLLESCVKIVTQ